jgi:hypothetical protein
VVETIPHDRTSLELFEDEDGIGDMEPQSLTTQARGQGESAARRALRMNSTPSSSSVIMIVGKSGGGGSGSVKKHAPP